MGDPFTVREQRVIVGVPRSSGVGQQTIEMEARKMRRYEAAVKMFHREQARWNQWVLFFFGSLVSIFVLGEKMKLYIPDWIPALLACIISVIWVAVATTLRASTNAWLKTILELEEKGRCEDTEVKVFHTQYEKWQEFSHWGDLKTTLRFWKKETITSVTRILVLLGVLSALVFLLLSIAIFVRWN